MSVDGIAAGEHAVAGGSGLGPDPSSANVVVVEIAPEIVLTTLGLAPVPGLLDVEVRAIHVAHVPAVGELGELGLGSECRLAEVVSSGVAGDLDSPDGISDCDDSSSPAFVEGLIGICVGREVGVVVVVGTAEDFGVDDAEERKALSAGSVSELGVAAVAGHPAHEAVLLLRPYGGCECKSLLVGNALAEVGVELLHWVAGGGGGSGQAQQQAEEQAVGTRGHKALIYLKNSSVEVSGYVYYQVQLGSAVGSRGRGILFNFATYMQQKGEYRIRGQKRTEEDFEEEIEEQLKLSTHAKGQRRQNSAALSRKHHQSSQNSRIADSRANSRISSSVIGSRVGRVLRNSRTDKNGVVDIEFNNVRWISIVSAYDSKRLKNVTVSKQSCESFLKRYGHGIKNDAAAMALFKDIKRHFHSWLGRINEAFSEVIDGFMRVSDRAPLQNFKKMSPVLESITKDTGMMEEKLEGCLRVYENNDFRKLFARFQSFNQFSNKLEELIKGIYASKHRIDELFAELQNNQDQRMVDKKVERIIKKGIREAESLIDDTSSNNAGIRDRIISKVKLAINDLAEKSLNLFHRVKGAKELIRRLHGLINDSRRSLESSEIRKLSKIFKAVIEEADKFEDFVANFNGQEEHVSPKLREKLNQYSESIGEEKRAVCEIQLIFVQTVIGETLETLKHNHLLHNALAPNQQKLHYSEFNHTLEEVADAMLDLNSRGPIDALIKHGKAHFSKLEDELDKIRRALRKNEGVLLIDTENGEIEVMEFCNLADRYKTKLRTLISKHEEALRSLGIFFREARLPDNQRDAELGYFKDLKKLVETVNSKQRRQAFARLRGFADVPNGASVGVLAVEATEALQLVQELNGNKKQAAQFMQNNPVKNLVKSILFENSLYLEAQFLLEAFEIAGKTTEKSLIESLTKLTENNSRRQGELGSGDYRASKSCLHLYERLYCLALSRGIKKEMLKELDDSRLIAFPQNEYDAKKMENEIKYRSLVAETIGEGGQFCRGRVRATVKVMKDMVLSYRIIERVSNNAEGQFIIPVAPLGQLNAQIFAAVTSKEELAEKAPECRRVVLDCIKALKSRLANVELADQEIDMETADAALKARNAILHVQTINQNALRALEELAKNSDPLEIFSQFVHTIAEYVRQSKQPAYVALNEFRQPIWLGPTEQAREGMVAETGLKGYKRGVFTDDYLKQAPRVRKEQKKEEKKEDKKEEKEKSASGAKGSKEKNIIVREHSHQKQSMDEEIAVIESENDMEEHIESFREADIQDLPNDEIEDIPDDMQEDIIDDMQEEIEEKSANEQIDEEPIEEVSHSPKKVKEEQKQAERKADVSVFQVIPHFKELEQIRALFVLISSTECEFWSSQVDYSQVEDYFHRPMDLKGRASFTKSLESCLSLFLGSRFEKGLAEEVRKLDRFVALRQKFGELGDRSWDSLFGVLSSIDFSYSLLLRREKEEIVQLKIAAKNSPGFKKEGARLAVEAYLSRCFKSSHYLPSQFQLDDYLSYCFRVEQQEQVNTNGDGFHYVIKVVPQFKEALPDEHTHTQMSSLQDVEEAFSTQLSTGIDLQALLLHLWVKAVCAEAEDYYKPDYSVLNRHLKTLELAEKKEWVGYYAVAFRKTIMTIKEKIKAHKALIDNTLFKVDSSNIWACLAKVSELYQPKINKQVFFVDTRGQEKLLFAVCEGQQVAITHESALSTFLYDLFLLNGDKKPRSAISEQEVLGFVGQQLQKEGRQDELQNISSLLNILEINHFYTTEPKFIIRSNLQQLVLAVISNLGITNKQELEYQSLFQDLFKVKQQAFTNVLSLKPHLSHDILAKKHIDSTCRRITELGKEARQRSEAFTTAILSSDMAAIFFSALNGQPNPIVQNIQTYRQWLQTVKQEFDSQLLSKDRNISLYVKAKSSEAAKIYGAVTQGLLELEPIASPQRQSGNLLRDIEEGSNLLRSIAKWATAKLATRHCSFFCFNQADRVLTFGLQFNEADARKSLRSFLGRHVKDSVSKTEWQAFFGRFYSAFVERRVQVQQDNGHTEIHYDLAQVASDLRQRIRSDLVDVQDMLMFTRLYNQHRFGSTPSVLKKLEEVHGRLLVSLREKIFLVETKAKVERCSWNGLQKLEALGELFECFRKELPYDQEYLSQLLKATEEIGVKETDLAGYIEWFMQCGAKELKMQHYVLKSSRDVLVTIFPVARIEKDRTKSSEDIRNFLAEIKLPSKYSVSLEQGLPTIRLEQEVINCSLLDSSNFLTQQSQLTGFEADLPEGETLLLSYYQSMSDGQKIPLYIGEVQLQTQCVLHLREYQTSSSVSCAIWKCARQDYQDWRKEHATPNEEAWTQLRKKMRGLASGEERVREVFVGQSLSFGQVGSWLAEEVRQHLRRVEEKERAEQERKRVMLTIAESEKFLEAIYHGMLKNEMLPTLKLSLKDVEEFRSTTAEESSAAIQGYWKKILDSNKKIIEKLEESKSSEEMNRITALIKDFLKMLKIKLIQNQLKEEQIVEKAKQGFTVIEQKRKEQKEAELEQKRLEKQQRRLLRQAEAEEKAKLAQEQADKQANSLNITPNLLVPTEVNQVEQLSEQAQAVEVEVDEGELILACEQLKSIRKGKEEQLYMSYLVHLLQSQQPRDSEYFQLLLKAFWAESAESRRSLVMLQ